MFPQSSETSLGAIYLLTAISFSYLTVDLIKVAQKMTINNTKTSKLSEIVTNRPSQCFENDGWTGERRRHGCNPEILNQYRLWGTQLKYDLNAETNKRSRFKR